MKQRTTLPLLLSTLFLWTLTGSLGCGGNTGGGAGATGGTGGGDTGGSTTGGSDTGGAGGSSTGGSTTGGAGGAPACVGHTSKIFGCLQSSKLDESPAFPIDLQMTGVVSAVRAPTPGEICGPTYWYQLGFSDKPEVMIDLAIPGGDKLTVGLAIPGLPAGAIHVGETLSVKYDADIVGFGARAGALKIERDGAFVAGIGEGMPAGVTPQEGTVECYSEDALCAREERVMEVPAPDGTTVSIPNGEMADVGDLTVMNDRFLHNYDVSGGCNFGLAVEYLMSAVAK